MTLALGREVCCNYEKEKSLVHSFDGVQFGIALSIIEFLICLVVDRLVFISFKLMTQSICAC